MNENNNDQSWQSKTPKLPQSQSSPQQSKLDHFSDGFFTHNNNSSNLQNNSKSKSKSESADQKVPVQGPQAQDSRGSQDSCQDFQGNNDIGNSGGRKGSFGSTLGSFCDNSGNAGNLARRDSFTSLERPSFNCNAKSTFNKKVYPDEPVKKTVDADCSVDAASNIPIVLTDTITTNEPTVALQEDDNFNFSTLHYDNFNFSTLNYDNNNAVASQNSYHGSSEFAFTRSTNVALSGHVDLTTVSSAAAANANSYNDPFRNSTLNSTNLPSMNSSVNASMNSFNHTFTNSNKDSNMKSFMNSNMNTVNDSNHFSFSRSANYFNNVKIPSILLNYNSNRSVSSSVNDNNPKQRKQSIHSQNQMKSGNQSQNQGGTQGGNQTHYGAIQTQGTFQGASNNATNHPQQNEFLYNLHTIISDPNNHEIISWLPHGQGFIINNKPKFEKEILPSFLPNTKYASFTRRLKRWRFFRVPSGAEMGAYYHANFQRNKAQLIHLINTHEAPPIYPELITTISSFSGTYTGIDGSSVADTGTSGSNNSGYSNNDNDMDGMNTSPMKSKTASSGNNSSTHSDINDSNSSNSDHCSKLFDKVSIPLFQKSGAFRASSSGSKRSGSPLMVGDVDDNDNDGDDDDVESGAEAGESDGKEGENCATDGGKIEDLFLNANNKVEGSRTRESETKNRSYKLKKKKKKENGNNNNSTNKENGTITSVSDVRDFPQIMREISRAKRLESLVAKKKRSVTTATATILSSSPSDHFASSANFFAGGGSASFVMSDASVLAGYGSGSRFGGGASNSNFGITGGVDFASNVLDQSYSSYWEDVMPSTPVTKSIPHPGQFQAMNDNPASYSLIIPSNTNDGTRLQQQGAMHQEQPRFKDDNIIKQDQEVQKEHLRDTHRDKHNSDQQDPNPNPNPNPWEFSFGTQSDNFFLHLEKVQKE